MVEKILEKKTIEGNLKGKVIDDDLTGAKINLSYISEQGGKPFPLDLHTVGIVDNLINYLEDNKKYSKK